MRKTRGGGVLAGVLVLSLVGASIGWGDTIAVRVTAENCEDATGIQAAPTKNYGASATIGTRGVATLRRHGFITWDLSSIPPEADVVSASCSLYVETNTTDGDTYFGCLVESWIEGTGDNTAPPHDACSWTYRQEDELSWTSAGGTYDHLEDTLNITKIGWVMAEVDSAIQRLVNGSGYGIMVAPTPGASTDNAFTSSEGTEAQRPILNVTYTVPPISGSIVDGDRGIVGGGIVR